MQKQRGVRGVCKAVEAVCRTVPEPETYGTPWTVGSLKTPISQEGIEPAPGCTA